MNYKFRKKTLFIGFVLFAAFVIQSCSTKKCVLCELDNKTVYNIDLNESGEKNFETKQIKSYFPPVPVEAANKKTNLYVVNCNNTEAYRLNKGKEMELFIKNNLLLIDSLDIALISTSSDADLLPEIHTLSSLSKNNELNMCNRMRKPFKVELRGMVGFRSFEPSTYQPLMGDTPIEKPTFGIGPEGTKITAGAEIALMPTLFNFNNRNSLNLGLLTGYWPVDGGHFIPLAIHPRLTFNNITNPLWGNCNAYYLFADLGTAYDITSNFDKFWSNKLNAIFWDLGAGFDFWKTKNMDLSVDFGYRQTTLPLEAFDENSEWINCINAHNIAYSQYPRRRSGQFFIRFGVTF